MNFLAILVHLTLLYTNLDNLIDIEGFEFGVVGLNFPLGEFSLLDIGDVFMKNIVKLDSPVFETCS